MIVDLARENLQQMTTTVWVWTGLSSCTFVQILINDYKAARLHIKRILLISLYSKEYVSLRTDLKASDGLEQNSKVIGDLGLNEDNFILSVKKFCYVYSNGQLVLPLWWLWPSCRFLPKKYIYIFKVTLLGNKHVSKYFQTATALKHRNAQKRQT